MKLSKVLFGVTLAASTSLVLATEPAPVIDVSSPQQSSKTLVEQLTNLERKLDSRNRAQVNILQQLNELQTEVNELRGVTELHNHKLGQILERQRELYQELDRRVSEALKPENKASAVSDNNLTTQYSSDLTENEAYDRAVNLVLKDKLYEQAIPEFRAFNQKYPNSTYAANAHY